MKELKISQDENNEWVITSDKIPGFVAKGKTVPLFLDFLLKLDILRERYLSLKTLQKKWKEVNTKMRYLILLFICIGLVFSFIGITGCKQAPEQTAPEEITEPEAVGEMMEEGKEMMEEDKKMPTGGY